MHLVLGLVLVSLLLSGCWGEPKSESSDAPAAKEPPKSMAERRSLDPVSTPIYAGEDAKAKIEKAMIGNAIRGFQEAEGRNPSSLQELVDKKYISSLPREPVGYRFSYDPQSGTFDTVLKPE